MRGQPHAAPALKHFGGRAPVQMRPGLGTVRISRKPAGNLRMGFFKRQGPSAQFFIKLAVQVFAALHAGGLVGYVIASIRGHPDFKVVHGPEKTFNRL